MTAQTLSAERIVVAGSAHGTVCVLDEPLSLWGGFDIDAGTIVDEHHPQRGQALAGAVVAMASGRGSSSSSSVLVEAARRGTAPAAFIVQDADEILATGSIVADVLYGHCIPIVVVGPHVYAAVVAAERVTVDHETIVIEPAAPAK